MPFSVNPTDRAVLLGIQYRPETDDKGELRPPRMLHKGDVYHHPAAGLVQIENERTPGSAYHQGAADPANHQHVWVIDDAPAAATKRAKPRKKPASKTETAAQ